MPTFRDACEAVLRDPGGDHSLYTTLAPLYERTMAAADEHYAARLRTVEAHVPVSARTVLEVGCGVGRLLPDLAERHGVAVGSTPRRNCCRSRPTEWRPATASTCSAPTSPTPTST